jgi:hypothetical protein
MTIKKTKDKEPKLYYAKITTHKYRVYNKKKFVIGEIHNRMVGNHYRWVFCPIPHQYLGDLWFSSTYLKELYETMTLMQINRLVD